MPDVFAQGAVLHSVKGKEIHVEKLRACSDGAAVYDVTINGEKKYLRWIRAENGRQSPEARRESIREKMEAGSPGKYVCWPEDMTELSEDGFGYITCPALKDSFSVREVAAERTFAGWRERLNGGIRLALAYAALHEQGWCVQDYDPGFRFNEKGDVLFWDCEALVPAGGGRYPQECPAFSPPELLREQSIPNENTDRYGLGVYLFGLLGMGHPLEGLRHLVPLLTPEVEKRLYEQEPLFLFDPENPENRPHPVLHRGAEETWEKLPEYVRELFLRLFGREGLGNPGGRPTEAEWILALCRMKNERMICSCGRDVFSRAGAVCAGCGKPLHKVPRLVFGDSSMPVIRGRKVYRCLLGEKKPDRMMETVALVVEEEQRPGMLRLKNTGGGEWTAFTPSGAEKTVRQEETVPVMAGITVFMDGTEVKIENS